VSDQLRTHIARVARHLELGHDHDDTAERMQMCEDIALLIIGARRQEQEAIDRRYIADRLLVVAAAMKVGGPLDQIADELAELSVRVEAMDDKYTDGVLPE